MCSLGADHGSSEDHPPRGKLEGWTVPDGVPFTVFEEVWKPILVSDPWNCEYQYCWKTQRTKKVAGVLTVRRQDVGSFRQHLRGLVEAYESGSDDQPLLTLSELMHEVQRVYDELLWAASEKHDFSWTSVETWYEPSEKKSPATAFLSFFTGVFELSTKSPQNTKSPQTS